ncbi:hypothetical protein [Amycolatopsis sp. NBC_01286]|nr:hypothetical protein OG570_16410 [Amycolatopsis sp. NBC_01286]
MTVRADLAGPALLHTVTPSVGLTPSAGLTPRDLDVIAAWLTTVA